MNINNNDGRELLLPRPTLGVSFSFRGHPRPQTVFEFLTLFGPDLLLPRPVVAVIMRTDQKKKKKKKEKEKEKRTRKATQTTCVVCVGKTPKCVENNKNGRATNAGKEGHTCGSILTHSGCGNQFLGALMRFPDREQKRKRRKGKQKGWVDLDPCFSREEVRGGGGRRREREGAPLCRVRLWSLTVALIKGWGPVERGPKGGRGAEIWRFSPYPANNVTCSHESRRGFPI